jgi:hypothetical protein
MCDNLLLRQEAYGLSGRLFMAMLSCPADDDDRYARLKHAQRRAERRYWRRYDADVPRGNQTPPWFYKTASPGY